MSHILTQLILDREYRNVIKKSLLQPIQQPANGASDEVSFDEDIALPIPKVYHSRLHILTPYF
jgi:hypothetical protein